MTIQKKTSPPPINFAIGKLTRHDGEEEYYMYVILPNDDTDGFIIGEMDDVIALAYKLNRFLETGEVDEDIHRLDERLGHRWLTVSQASKKYGVPRSTVQRAARVSNIQYVKQDGNIYIFPEISFKWWYAKKYRKGKSDKNKFK